MFSSKYPETIIVCGNNGFENPNKDCLNIIHTIVELFDKHFNNVCELDIVFEFQQAYHILGKFLTDLRVVHDVYNCSENYS